jgi:hypothetical protein
MKIQKLFKKNISKVKSSRHLRLGASGGSKKTHLTPVGNVLVQASNDDVVDYIDSLISDQFTSHCNPGFIPIVNNINNKYISIVENCQKRNVAKIGSYEPIFSHAPKSNEIEDCLWGLERVINYRVNSEIKVSYKDQPLFVYIELSALSKTLQKVLPNLLKNGPSVGVHFILSTTDASIVNVKHIQSQVDLTGQAQNIAA